MDVLRLRFRDKIIEVPAEKAKRGGIRWIIGTPDGARSSTWRLWANKKGDVYISRRVRGLLLKVRGRKPPAGPEGSQAGRNE